MPTEPIVPTFILQSDGLFREGLRLMLSRTRFRPQACGMELDSITGVPSNGPVLFIVGIEQKQDSICRRIRTKYPSCFIVAVGDEADRDYIKGALNNGANAALLSSVSPHALVSALYSVVNGRLLVIDDRLWPLEVQPKPQEQQSASISQSSSPPQHVPSIQNFPLWAGEDDPHTAEHLSAREIAILERIVRGDSNKHVARFFNIAEPTVKAHVKAIFRKVGASNRTQAAIWALNHHLFDSPISPSQDLPPAAQHPETSEEYLQSSPSSAFKTNGNGVMKNGRAVSAKD